MSLQEAPPLEMTLTRGGEIESLVERARAGDAGAFEEIIRLHERRVLAISIQMGLSSADAQDVCQEVFLRAFRYLSGFRPGWVFGAWLSRIVVHVVYDFLRKRRDRGEIPWEAVLSDAGAPQASSGGLDLQVENADLVAKLLRRMESLTQQERMVFVLRDLHDLSTWVVSRTLRISPITVRRHSTSARQKLKEVLRELAGQEKTGFDRKS